MNALKLKNVRHHEVVRVSTTDAATADTLLRTATDEELATYFAGRAKMNPGKIWDGIWKPALQAMDKATRDKILKSLDDYGNELGKSKAEGETEVKGLTFGGENEDEEQPQNKLEREVESKDSPMRQWRNQDFRRIDDIQKANESFWKRK